VLNSYQEEKSETAGYTTFNPIYTHAMSRAEDSHEEGEMTDDEPNRTITSRPHQTYAPDFRRDRRPSGFKEWDGERSFERPTNRAPSREFDRFRDNRFPREFQRDLREYPPAPRPPREYPPPRDYPPVVHPRDYPPPVREYPQAIREYPPPIRDPARDYAPPARDYPVRDHPVRDHPMSRDHPQRDYTQKNSPRDGGKDEREQYASHWASHYAEKFRPGPNSAPDAADLYERKYQEYYRHYYEAWKPKERHLEERFASPTPLRPHTPMDRWMQDAFKPRWSEQDEAAIQFIESENRRLFHESNVQEARVRHARFETDMATWELEKWEHQSILWHEELVFLETGQAPLSGEFGANVTGDPYYNF
jgi:hypothetical protein